MENEIKPLTKEELIKRIEEYKPKYIYQRYAGKINKYEILFDNELLNLETGIHIDLDRHAMLGKVSGDIFDLINAGDIGKFFMEEDVNGEDTNWFEIIAICKDTKELGVINKDYQPDFFPFENLREIITYEQMESITYKVKE